MGSQITEVRDEAVVQHHRRVAAFAIEIGRSLGLGDVELGLLEEAAEWHDIPVQLLEPDARTRLLGDVLGKPLPVLADPDPLLPHNVSSVIAGFQGFRGLSAASRPMEILYIADALDEYLEAEPYFQSPDEPSDDPPLHGIALDLLRRTSTGELQRIVPRLPVFPANALRAIMDLVRPGLEVSDLERIAKTDPVLAGTIVSAANSARFTARNRIRSLAHTISFVGISFTRDLLLTAVLRPAFSMPGLQPIWQHSVQCAEIAGMLADRTHAVPRSEAVLAGLMHDTGVLALSMLSPEATAACERLIGRGCPNRAAESVVFGFDHAQASAQVLETWKFSQDLIDAVRHHHSPEHVNSPFASILYLAEFCSGSEEDLPSAARLRGAASCVGLTVDEVVALKVPGELTALFAQSSVSAHSG